MNIDQFTIVLEQTTHLRGVHGRGLGDMPGKWNQRWAEWFKKNPEATPEEAWRFAEGLLKEYGLDELPIGPYK